MIRTPENNTPPPPVTVNRFDELRSIFTVDPHACGAALRSFGLADVDIENTEIHATNEDHTTEHRDPMGHDAIIPHYNASSGREVDGAGHVWLHMGSVLRASFSDQGQELVAGQDAAQDKLYSSLLIAGLSQRADLTTMGRDALLAEQQAAEKALRKAPILKAVGKSALATAVGLTADVVAAHHDVLSTPVAWGLGAVGVLAAAVWAKTSAKLEILQKRSMRDVYRGWPAQRRAHERTKAYLEDPIAQPLIRLGVTSQ